jgi:hypothetical protein
MYVCKIIQKTAKNLSHMSVELLYLLYIFTVIGPRFGVMRIFLSKTDIRVCDLCETHSSLGGARRRNKPMFLERMKIVTFT